MASDSVKPDSNARIISEIEAELKVFLKVFRMI